jgi:hypothetical protein
VARTIGSSHSSILLLCVESIPVPRYFTHERRQKLYLVTGLRRESSLFHWILVLAPIPRSFLIILVRQDWMSQKSDCQPSLLQKPGSHAWSVITEVKMFDKKDHLQ